MRLPRPSLRRAPSVSLVGAVYGVAEYLPRFLASLDAQDHPHERLQVVLVLDGAVDGSPAICREWAARTDIDAVVLETENGGQGRARNLGLERATGEWVGFPDPDDELEPAFISTLLAARTADAGMLIARTLIHQRGTVVPHPLDFRFQRGTRRVDVTEQPNAIQLSTHEVLIRGDLACSCRFPEDREAPTFEDGVYVGRVRALNPVCVLVPEAVYHYEKRQAGDSAVQTAWSRPGRYTAQFTDRYQPYLNETGGAPWAQMTILYDLGWYCGVVDRGEMPTEPIGLAEEHARLLTELVSRLDADFIVSAPWGHLGASARARLLLMKGVPEVAVTRAGHVHALFTAVPVSAASSPAVYAGQQIGLVATGDAAEDAFSGAGALRITGQRALARMSGTTHG